MEGTRGPFYTTRQDKTTTTRQQFESRSTEPFLHCGVERRPGCLCFCKIFDLIPTAGATVCLAVFGSLTRGVAAAALLSLLTIFILCPVLLSTSRTRRQHTCTVYCNCYCYCYCYWCWYTVVLALGSVTHCQGRVAMLLIAALVWGDTAAPANTHDVLDLTRVAVGCTP